MQAVWKVHASPHVWPCPDLSTSFCHWPQLPSTSTLQNLAARFSEGRLPIDNEKHRGENWKVSRLCGLLWPKFLFFKAQNALRPKSFCFWYFAADAMFGFCVSRQEMCHQMNVYNCDSDGVVDSVPAAIWAAQTAFDKRARQSMKPTWTWLDGCGGNRVSHRRGKLQLLVPPDHHSTLLNSAVSSSLTLTSLVFWRHPHHVDAKTEFQAKTHLLFQRRWTTSRRSHFLSFCGFLLVFLWVQPTNHQGRFTPLSFDSRVCCLRIQPWANIVHADASMGGQWTGCEWNQRHALWTHIPAQNVDTERPYVGILLEGFPSRRRQSALFGCASESCSPVTYLLIWGLWHPDTFHLKHAMFLATSPRLAVLRSLQGNSFTAWWGDPQQQKEEMFSKGSSLFDQLSPKWTLH